MEKIKISKKLDKLSTINFSIVGHFQGDLKKYNEEKCNKLKEIIKKRGILFPSYVWVNPKDNKPYWNDGHTRQVVFFQLQEEGWDIPKIPYIEIIAKDEKEAAEILLEKESHFADFNLDTKYFEKYDIDLSFLDDIEIPEFDIKKNPGVDFIYNNDLETSQTDHFYSGHSLPFRIGDTIAFISDEAICENIKEFNSKVFDAYGYEQGEINIFCEKLLTKLFEDYENLF